MKHFSPNNLYSGLVLSLSLGLTACGGGGSTTTTPSNGSNTPATVTPVVPPVVTPKNTVFSSTEAVYDFSDYQSWLNLRRKYLLNGNMLSYTAEQIKSLPYSKTAQELIVLTAAGPYSWFDWGDINVATPFSYFMSDNGSEYLLSASDPSKPQSLARTRYAYKKVDVSGQKINAYLQPLVRPTSLTDANLKADFLASTSTFPAGSIVYQVNTETLLDPLTYFSVSDPVNTTEQPNGISSFSELKVTQMPISPAEKKVGGITLLYSSTVPGSMSYVSYKDKIYVASGTGEPSDPNNTTGTANEWVSLYYNKTAADAVSDEYRKICWSSKYPTAEGCTAPATTTN